MGDSARKVTYFYATVPDKAGEGAKVLEGLTKAGVDMLAYSGFPSPKSGHAQLDFAVEDGAKLQEAAKKLKLELTGPKTAFLVQGDDRPGAVASIVAKLAAAKVSITAMDGVAAGGGRWGAILWVKPADVDKAAKALGAS